MCWNVLKHINYELDEKEGPFNGPSFSSSSRAILTSGEP